MNLWDNFTLAHTLGLDGLPEFVAHGVSINTRTLQPGDIFIALQGPNFDGHDFIAEALAKGAACALIHHDVADVSGPMVRCGDTYDALWLMARAALQRDNPTVIAITGSVGKTSTKEALALIFGAIDKTWASEGNLNNNFGLPLMCARMPAGTKYCVLEMGMNNAGEITLLSKLAKPDIAIVTNVWPVHLENFDDISGIAHAKAEIYDGMAQGGFAIMDADNAMSDILYDKARKSKLHIRKFGNDKAADYRVRDICLTSAGTKAKMQIGDSIYDLGFRALGKHLAKNAVAALGAAHILGVDMQKAIAALGQLDMLAGRGKRHHLQIGDADIIVIDESYNASPMAVKAAIETMAQAHGTQGIHGTQGRLCVALGDMGELGPNAPEMHAQLHDALLGANVAQSYLCGPLMENLAKHVQSACFHRQTAQELSDVILQNLRDGDVLLVKGSLSMGMKIIVDALRDNAHD